MAKSLRSRLDVGRCWSFNHDEQPAYPTIEVTLSSLNRRLAIRPKVDTGFNGSLAIGSDDVRRLRLTPAGTVLVRTATGSNEVLVYLVKISQPELGIAYTTLAIGTERSLVGRKLLQNRTWLLDCREGRFCAITGAARPLAKVAARAVKHADKSEARAEL